MEDYLQKYLRYLEKDFANYPERIWEYLKPNELLLTRSSDGVSAYIICTHPSSK